MTRANCALHILQGYRASAGWWCQARSEKLVNAQRSRAKVDEWKRARKLLHGDVGWEESLRSP
jgi:hypothetical protein